MTYDEVVKVVEAYKQGKTIQVRLRGDDTWHDAGLGVASTCNIDTITNAYRVKPSTVLVQCSAKFDKYGLSVSRDTMFKHNLDLKFDQESGELLEARVVK
jgi:hypothetical protein